MVSWLAATVFGYVVSRIVWRAFVYLLQDEAPRG